MLSLHVMLRAMLCVRRHDQILEQVEKGTYLTPVTPAFKRCQVLAQTLVLMACQPNPASHPFEYTAGDQCSPLASSRDAR